MSRNPEQADQNESHRRASLFHKFRTARNIAFSENYDANVNPEEYQAHAENVYNRRSLSRALAGVVAQYVSPSIDENSPTKVLDMAAGTGIVSRALVAKGYRVTAVDLSQKALDYLQAQSSTVETRQADMNDLFPFEDNSYDAATSVWGNRYIKNTNAFLHEMYRVLKPGGVFVWPIFPTERASWKLKSGLMQHTTSRSLTQDALKVGFSDAEIQRVSFREARIQNIPFHTIPRYIVATK